MARIHKANSKMPNVNCVFFPTVGWKGEEAAASQTSSSGVDMSDARAIGLVVVNC